MHNFFMSMYNKPIDTYNYICLLNNIDSREMKNSLLVM